MQVSTKKTILLKITQKEAMRKVLRLIKITIESNRKRFRQSDKEKYTNLPKRTRMRI